VSVFVLLFVVQVNLYNLSGIIHILQGNVIKLKH